MELLRPRTADRLITLLLIIFGIADTSIFAAEFSPALLKAKKEAEAKAYLFAASHDEILNRAKQEGKLRVIVSLDAGILKRLSEGFRKNILSFKSKQTRSGASTLIRGNFTN